MRATGCIIHLCASCNRLEERIVFACLGKMVEIGGEGIVLLEGHS